MGGNGDFAFPLANGEALFPAPTPAFSVVLNPYAPSKLDFSVLKFGVDAAFGGNGDFVFPLANGEALFPAPTPAFSGVFNPDGPPKLGFSFFLLKFGVDAAFGGNGDFVLPSVDKNFFFSFSVELSSFVGSSSADETSNFGFFGDDSVVNRDISGSFSSAISAFLGTFGAGELPRFEFKLDSSLGDTEILVPSDILGRDPAPTLGGKGNCALVFAGDAFTVSGFFDGRVLGGMPIFGSAV